MATPSVLVVGSTGSIGRHVVHAAALRGLGIRALSRDAARANRAFAGIPGVEVVQGDATEPASTATTPAPRASITASCPRCWGR